MPSDDVRPSSCQLRNRLVSDQLLASLYPPDVGPERIPGARYIVQDWMVRQLATPTRRLVGVVDPAPQPLRRQVVEGGELVV